MLRFEDEAVQLPEVPGSAIWEAVTNGISGLNANTINANNNFDADGKFLQFSSSMHVEWYFEDGEPTVWSIEIARAGTPDVFEPIDLTAMYSVGTTNFLRNGGDDYSMLENLPYFPLFGFLFCFLIRVFSVRFCSQISCCLVIKRASQWFEVWMNVCGGGSGGGSNGV